MQIPDWLDRVRAIIIEFTCGLGGKRVCLGIDVISPDQKQDHLFFQVDDGASRFPEVKLIDYLVKCVDKDPENVSLDDEVQKHVMYVKPCPMPAIRTSGRYHIADTLAAATRGLGGTVYKHTLTREFLFRNKVLINMLHPFPKDVTLSYMTKVTTVRMGKFMLMPPYEDILCTDRRVVTFDREFGAKSHPPVCYFVCFNPDGMILYEPTTFDEDGTPKDGTYRTVPLNGGCFYDGHNDLNAASVALHENQIRKELYKS